MLAFSVARKCCPAAARDVGLARGAAAAASAAAVSTGSGSPRRGFKAGTTVRSVCGCAADFSSFSVDRKRIYFARACRGVFCFGSPKHFGVFFVGTLEKYGSDLHLTL